MNSFKLHFLARVSFLFITVICSIQAQAIGWSLCQTVTGVTDSRSSSVNGVIISTYPGVTGPGGAPCNAWMGSGTLRVGIGLQGQNADTVKAALTLATTAYLTGKKVMFYYDNSGGTCDVMYMSLGGYVGQCN